MIEFIGCKRQSLHGFINITYIASPFKVMAIRFHIYVHKQILMPLKKYGTNQQQLKRHTQATRNKNACLMRVQAIFQFCMCLHVLSLNFSIIVNRHFKVINRTL